MSENISLHSYSTESDCQARPEAVWETGTMQDNFFLYPEVQPSTGIRQRTFPCTHTAPNLSYRHDRKLYGKTGIMQDNFFLYPEVQSSAGICQRTFHCTHTAPNLSGRLDRKLYGKTGTMQNNFFLYPEVQSSTVYASLHSLTPIHVNL